MSQEHNHHVTITVPYTLPAYSQRLEYDSISDEPYEASKSKHSKLCFFISFVVVILSGIASLFWAVYYAYDRAIPKVFPFTSGDRVYVQVESDGRYLLTDPNNNIVLHNTTWLVGSQFELVSKDQQYWQLKSIKADSFIVINMDTSSIIASTSSPGQILSFMMTPLRSRFDDHTKEMALMRTDTGVSIDKKGSLPSLRVSVYDAPLKLKLHKVHQVTGVNLGSWFIPERWMAPTSFYGEHFVAFCDQNN